MAYQTTVRNGPAAANNKQQGGVIEGVSSFGTDLATLVMLQTRLAAYDLRDSMKSAAPAIAGLVAFVVIVAASTVVGLAGLALVASNGPSNAGGHRHDGGCSDRYRHRRRGLCSPGSVAGLELFDFPPVARRTRSQPGLDQNHDHAQRSLNRRSDPSAESNRVELSDDSSP